MNQTERLHFLILELLKENPKYSEVQIPAETSEKKQLLRSLFNVRPAMSANDKFIRIHNEYLQEEIKTKGITDIDKLKPITDNLYLWQGDITTLQCDAIVNAANSGMLGCFVPGHACIDNAIHTFAGVQLRQECNDIMQRQGKEEPTGKAKITSAYNLPSKHIIHTVGPIVSGKLTDHDRTLLEDCYRSCLEIAVQNNLNIIAFCCISTGMFGFPPQEAAEIAVATVNEFLDNSKIKVVFNVFYNKDFKIYSNLLNNHFGKII